MYLNCVRDIVLLRIDGNIFTVNSKLSVFSSDQEQKFDRGRVLAFLDFSYVLHEFNLLVY